MKKAIITTIAVLLCWCGVAWGEPTLAGVSLSGVGVNVNDWTPATATTDGTVLPEHWYDASTGTWQDSAMTSVADTDTDPVGGWEDRAAVADDLLQATTTKRPLLQTNELNGNSTLRFDGTDDYIFHALTNGGTVSNPFTLFIVAKLDATAVDDGSYHFMFDGNNSGDRCLACANSAPTPDKWNFSAGTTVYGSATDSDWHLFTWVANGASSDLWLEGVGDATGNMGSDTFNYIAIGAATNGASSWKGDIAEFLIYDGALSDADKNQIGNYLANKYGLSYTNIE